MSESLLLRLDAPLMSFGGVAVDNRGVEMPLPAASMMTGLLGNALGLRRQDFAELNALQSRLRFVVRMNRDGFSLTDFQTAELNKSDQGWTTRGEVESRDGGAGTYAGKHIRYRDFHADRRVVIALWLEPAEQEPTLAQLQVALQHPHRPLFIGRKSCLPSTYIDAGIVEAASPLDALATQPVDSSEPAVPATVFELLPTTAPPKPGDLRVSGIRVWENQVHGGEQRWRASSLVPKDES